MRSPRAANSSGIRPIAALAASAVAVESLLSAATPNAPGRGRLIAALTPDAVPALAHLLALVASLVLLGLVPGLWRGTRRAWKLSLALLVAIGGLNLVKGLDFDETLLDLALVLVLCFGRSAFVLGCVARPRLVLAIGAVTVWASVYIVLLLDALAADRVRAVSASVRGTVGHSGTAVGVVDGLVAVAVLASIWLVRGLLAPSTSTDGHGVAEHGYAGELVRRHGRDSLSPFILREDKALHFYGGAVLAYRVLGDTAVISGDPVGPDGSAPAILGDFIALAGTRGWQVVVTGASERLLGQYTGLGLRHLHIGNEAYLDPRALSLDGRRMRKVRQSVHRVTRRGWRVEAVSAAEVGRALAREIAALEEEWRAEQGRIVGFAMSMGPWEAEWSAQDLIVLGREPGGELRGLLRFAAHPGGLSLEAMRRIGECPNGLTEAMVVRAIEVAREREVEEVSLNFAGFAHLMTAAAAELEIRHRVARFLLGLLGDRFQMERLVRFNEKFLPSWRPRYLIFDSRTRLPHAALRVLQAEAYLPAPRNQPLAQRWAPAPRTLSGEG
jgi:lysyl-tRNA synthetase class 2